MAILVKPASSNRSVAIPHESHDTFLLLNFRCDLKADAIDTEGGEMG